MKTLLLKIKKLSWQNIVVLTTTLLIAFLLKSHYSSSSSDDLTWILSPTAGLVEALTGTAFELEKGAGYVSREVMMIISKSCAGINFLIICFCMTSFLVLPKIKKIGAKFVTLFSLLAGTFLITITANTVRIILAIYLYSNDIQFGWLSPSRIHRFEGIAVYFAFLWFISICLNLKKGKKYAS